MLRPGDSCNTTDVVIDIGEKEEKDLVVDTVKTVIDNEVDKDIKDTNGENDINVNEENVIRITRQSHLDDRTFSFETNDEKKMTGTVAKKTKEKLIEDTNSEKNKEHNEKKI